MFKDIRVILALVVTIVLTVAIVFGGQQVLEWKAGAEQNVTRGNRMQATSDIIGDGAVADQQRAATDTGLATGKQEFTFKLEEAKRNEPETADRADNTVPDSVRRAYRERRLARQRLGCIGEQCRPRSEDEDAAER